MKKVKKGEHCDDFTVDSRSRFGTSQIWAIARPKKIHIFRATLNCYVGTLLKKCLLTNPLLHLQTDHQTEARQEGAIGEDWCSLGDRPGGRPADSEWGRE